MKNKEIYKVEKPEVNGNVINYEESRDKKFTDLHELYNEWETTIRRSSINKVKEIRKNFVGERHKLDHIIKEHKLLSFGMKKFLKGKRKIVTNLISICNERITLINKVINNGTNLPPMAMKFIDIAAKELDCGVFQKILSKSIEDVKMNEYQLSIVKQFLEDKNYNK